MNLTKQPQEGAAARPLELDPARIAAKDRKPFAVVDIGSNSVRLVVYDELGRAPFPRFNEKSLCGLGAGLAETGKLAAQAIDHTLHAAHGYAAIAEAMGVGRIDIIATESVRRATNGTALVAQIEARTGLATRVLSGAEEARYSALGVISGFHRPEGLVGDLGGGSLEIAENIGGEVGERSVSLPIGALPVRALLAELGDAAKERVDGLLRDRLPPPGSAPLFYVVGGGSRAMARIHMALSEAPVRVTHGYAFEAKEARALAKTIWRLPENQVATLPAAALVMDRVLKRLKPERVVFSSLGLRESWLYAQLSPEERARDPLVEGAQLLAVPRAGVPEFAPALVRWTDGLFAGETAAERRLRVAACALSDIAWRDHAEVQALQSFHRLVQFPFIGLDHGERVFLAAAIHARYAGKAEDPSLAPAIELLPASARRRAQILGRALLLGHRFSGSVPQILNGARLKIGPDLVRLEVLSTESVPDSDAVRARLKQLAKAVGVRRTEILKVNCF